MANQYELPFRNLIGGPGLERRCSRCRRWKTVKHFSQVRTGARAGEHLARCKECRNRDRVKHTESSGYLPLLTVWWIFDEVQRRIGTKEACSRLGVSDNNYRMILYLRNKQVQKRIVARTIVLLRELREQNVWDPPRTGRRSKHVARCAGCGGDPDNWTYDCTRCDERFRYRLKKGEISQEWYDQQRQHNYEHRMQERAMRFSEGEGRKISDNYYVVYPTFNREQILKLTGPQVLAMFTLLHTIGMKHVRHFDLLSQDDYGHVVIDVQTDSGTRRFKLFAHEGSQELTPAPKEAAPIVVAPEENNDAA